MIFGEYAVNNKLACNNENWKTLCIWIDGIVKELIEERAKKPNHDSDPECVFDIMMDAEVYKN